MSKLDITDRLAFLAEKFDVFETEDIDLVGKKCDDHKDSEWDDSQIIKGSSDNVIGILSTKSNSRGFPIHKVSIAYNVFTSMVGADPTPNKICLQWMLNTLSRYIKKNDWVEASRFAEEDLPQANEYLTLFEVNKRKKKFADMARYSLKGFKDITNINEYKNLGQLFDAVDPFIERNASEVESLMQRYVDAKQAIIPFKDRKYTVYIPLTREANVVFGNFAGWCTARAGNTNFESYTTKNRRPNGDKSFIYIVIDNGFFNGDNENIYQIHFETRQIKDRSNGSNIDLYSEVLCKSEGILNYFGEELMTSAKTYKGGFDSNFYLELLCDFGFTDILFDFFDVETPIIRIDAETSSKKRRVPRLPDVSKFVNMTHLVIMDSSLHELHASIGSLSNLKSLVIAGNKVTDLPIEIGKLHNLEFLNIWDNPISTIPNEIKYLDSSNGGRLKVMAVKPSDLGEANYSKLQDLLPNVTLLN
jgi:hypothetical protein